ncbi:hypothetical protein DRQ36_07440, partial [bacterium]
MRNLLLIYTLLFATITLTQDVLFNDVDNCHELEIWSYLLDTLTSHGATIHLESVEGWNTLDEMDMLWLQCPCAHPAEPYPDSITENIINFCEEGGKIVLGYIPATGFYIDSLLSDSRWEPNMQLDSTDEVNPDTIEYFHNISPLTNGVNCLVLTDPDLIYCGDHAFPFAFCDSNRTEAVAAISYPFLHEDNCSSFIILVTGTHSWETLFEIVADNYRFASNILLTAAEVPGFEFDPCAFAESVFVSETYSPCTRIPNPFTPNGDGIYDEVEFTFPGIGENEGVIKIFTLGNLKVRTIEVPAGAGAKEIATWDGTDNAGEPLLQGIYLYIIKSQGRIICKGTIT